MWFRLCTPHRVSIIVHWDTARTVHSSPTQFVVLVILPSRRRCVGIEALVIKRIPVHIHHLLLFGWVASASVPFSSCLGRRRASFLQRNQINPESKSKIDGCATIAILSQLQGIQCLVQTCT